MPSARLETPTTETMGNAGISAALMTMQQIQALATDAQAKHDQMNRRLNEAQQRIDRIDSQLRADIVAERARAIRQETDKALGDLAASIRVNGATAKAQRRHWTKGAVRRRAAFGAVDGMQGQVRLLEKASNGLLLEISRDAQAANNIPLAELILIEVNSRQGVEAGFKGEIRNLIDSVEVPAADEATGLLTEVEFLSDDALRLMLQSRTGKSDPMAKLNLGLRQRSA